MKRSLKYLCVALLLPLVFVALLVMLAPARLLQPLLTMTVPQLTLHGVDGSLWQGRASKALWQLDTIALDLGQLDWRLQPSSLFTTKPRVDLLLQEPSGGHRLSATVQIALTGEVKVAPITGQLPMAMFEPWFPVLMGGNVDVMIDLLRLQLPQQPGAAAELLGLNGLLSVQQATWLGGDRDMYLGSYQAQLIFVNDRVRITLVDLEGLLGLEGKAEIVTNGVYSFNAQLMPRPGLANEVIQSLGWLGQRSPDGHVTLQQQGRFRWQ